MLPNSTTDPLARLRADVQVAKFWAMLNGSSTDAMRAGDPATARAAGDPGCTRAMLRGSRKMRDNATDARLRELRS